MAIKNSRPMRFTPRGIVDAWDATDKFEGACLQLTNLVFDQSNPEHVVPRPGVFTITNLLGAFSAPTFISVQVSIGTRVYGMVSTSRFLGRDEPFCYDTATNQVVPISGVTAANTPVSPATVGDWEPPTISSVGIFILVTHPGMAPIGAGNQFGVIDLTVPSAPTWSMTTTATNALAGHPSAVGNLNNRAYFIVGNLAQFSDVLAPKTRTNASQSLTVGDPSPITGISGLPVQTTSSGVLWALTLFKATQVWQVTGDAATNDLALNYISLTVGTSSPRTIAQSPLGTYFLTTGGPYVINPLGGVTPLTNRMDSSDPDIQAPFINMQTPTRWAGAYNSSIYRVCGPTVIRGQLQTNDYWFDERRRRWNGPHTFAYDCASAQSGYFVLTGANTPGLLLRGQPSANLTTIYTDMGAQYTALLVSSFLPKVGEMSVKQMSESQMELGGLPAGALYNFAALNQDGNVMASAQVSILPVGQPLWGSAVWGKFNWTSQQALPPSTYPIPWPAPLVFEKFVLAVGATAGPTVSMGTFFGRYQKTGFMTLGPNFS